MTQSDQSDCQRETQQDQTHRRPSKWRVIVWVMGLFLLVGLVVGGLIALSAYLNKIVTDPVNFVIVNLLSALIFIAVCVQAVIYLRMTGQNERLIDASEQNANVARDAFYVGEAPYFGITSMVCEDVAVGRFIRPKISVMNGGKTPAWNVHTQAELIVGATPNSPHAKSWPLTPELESITATFIIAGKTQAFHYVSDCLYSDEMNRAVQAGREHIFVVFTIHYLDFRKRWHKRTFRGKRHTDGNVSNYDITQENCLICKRQHDKQD